MAAAIDAAGSVVSGSPDVRALEWAHDPADWVFVTLWRGLPIGYQRYRFPTRHPDPDAPQDVDVGFTVHLDRSRPAWFWRECERPVFEALLRLGFYTGRSRTRADRPDWIAALRESYGAEEVGRSGDGKWTVLRWDFHRARQLCIGWPARVVVPGWEYQEGTLVVREGREDELELVRQTMETIWSSRLMRRVSPRGSTRQRAIVMQMFEEWMELDKATLLLGFVSGELRHVRAVRRRRGQVSSVAWLTPLLTEQMGMTRALIDWHRRAGYERATAFLPLWQWEHPRVQEHAAKAGIREIRRIPLAQLFVEVERVVEQ